MRWPRAARVRCAATTHFGFRDVDVHEKERLVGDVFHRVAQSYDLMNDLMSGSLHRAWKDTFVDMAGPLASSHSETVVLDVAGGTGDIAFRLFETFQTGLKPPVVRPRIIVCDINPSMLAVGRSRASARGLIEHEGPEQGQGRPGVSAPRLDFVEGNAEHLPFPSSSVDLYTIAFGIRNVTNIAGALSEAHRVLKPGGRFMCLEFSHLTNAVAQQLYDAYSFNVIPALGEAVTADRAAYQYLVESIRKFPDQKAFAGMLRAAGLRGVSVTNLSMGVVAIHSGFKLPQLSTHEPAEQPAVTSAGQEMHNTPKACAQ